jgi:hypothetical protein
MKTILDILKQAGGWHHGLHLSIPNPPYMDLVIEAMDESGPLGRPALSVAHYGSQNGDAMRDPEMCFELGSSGLHLDPFYWRNDWVAVEQTSRVFCDGCYYEVLDLHEQHRQFAELWDTNLRLQGFVEAFDRAKYART